MQAYILFGLAGSGKGTQRSLLEKLFQSTQKSVLTLDTGHLLREYVTDTGAVMGRLKTVMHSGGLVPSAFPVTMWVSALMRQEQYPDCVIFDGAGRKRIEAEILVELLLFFPDAELHAILLDIPEQEAKRRLLRRGRLDDTEEAIPQRFELFRNTETGTAASLELLRAHPQVAYHVIDGVGTVDEVHQRIVTELAL